MKVKVLNELVEQASKLESILDKNFKYSQNLESRLDKKVKEVFEPYLKSILPKGSKVSYMRNGIIIKRIGIDGCNVPYGIINFYFKPKEEYNYLSEKASIKVARIVGENSMVEQKLLTLANKEEENLVKLMNDILAPFYEKEKQIDVVVSKLKEELRAIYQELKLNYSLTWDEYYNKHKFFHVIV
jgi:flagellar biosynthesis chaperone FliJ